MNRCYPCVVGDTLTIGPDQPLTIIGGPCVLESHETNALIGRTLRDNCERLGLPYIFKASFDKANRSSIRSPRGPGLQDGVRALRALRDELGVPTCTDIHESAQAAVAAEAADLLQVPAFLCRQTDLLAACAETGRAVNVKKGQFLSPGEMRHVVKKLEDAGAAQIMLTERGTTFGYHRLVNDFIGLGDLMELGRPVCFDVTHSTQMPGVEGEVTGGRPDRAPLLARAAAAAGVHALFLEAHPDPASARSDGATALLLETAVGVIETAARIHAALAGSPML